MLVLHELFMRSLHVEKAVPRVDWKGGRLVGAE